MSAFENEEYTPINILHDGMVRPIILAAEGPVGELQGCISAVFNCPEDIIGLHDIMRNIFYPVSMVTSDPSQFKHSTYELVFAKKSPETEFVDEEGTNETVNKHRAMTLADKLSSVRESIGLMTIDAIKLHKLLSQVSKTDEIITRDEFIAALGGLGSRPGKKQLASLLFDVFSCGAEFAVISELVNGLSVLCGGSLSEKILNSFALQDSDRDGYISQTNMVTYMRAVFTLLFQISPELRATAKCDPEDLAVKTTNHAFRTMGLKPGELMSFAQYKVWYINEDAEFGVAPDVDDLNDAGDEDDKSVSQQEEYDLDIFAVQTLLGLHSMKASDVVASFMMFADDYGRLEEEKYFGMFDQLIWDKTNKVDYQTRQKIESIKQRIFNVYEIADSGFLDVKSLTSGLSLFCGGSWADKAAAVFMAYGLGRSTYITKPVLTQHIISIFAMMTEFDPTFLSDATAVMVAEDMVKSAFGTNLVMSSEEFAQWLAAGADNMISFSNSGRQESLRYGQDDMVLLTELLESSGQSSDDDEVEDEAYECNENVVGTGLSSQGADEQTQALIRHELEYAKKILGLHMFSSDDLLDVVGEFSKEGIISATAWEEAVQHMLTLSGLRSSELYIAIQLARNLFDRLDAPGLRAVDYSSLILSLSSFCNSPLPDRVMVAFTVLEPARDGEVDYDELLKYFRSVFTAATVLSPTLLKTMVERNLNPDVLAELILDACLLQLNFTEVNQQFFNLENMTEIAEYCLERFEG